MHPLFIQGESDLDRCDDTVFVEGSGTVVAINETPPSFTMHGTQYISGGQNSDDIAVQALLHKNPRWKNPVERLPRLKAIVGFRGVLDRFDTYDVVGRTPATTCVVVSLDDITYLHNPPPPPPATSKKNKLRKKFKSHETSQSVTESTTTPSTSQSHQGQPDAQPPEHASTSRVRLGKRKANPSDDEVDDTLQSDDE
jgi:hypothetical protein